MKFHGLPEVRTNFVNSNFVYFFFVPSEKKRWSQRESNYLHMAARAYVLPTKVRLPMKIYSIFLPIHSYEILFSIIFC